MQHETSNVGKGNVEAVSVAIPAVMRVGGDGEHFFSSTQIFLKTTTRKSFTFQYPSCVYILVLFVIFFVHKRAFDVQAMVRYYNCLIDENKSPKETRRHKLYIYKTVNGRRELG